MIHLWALPECGASMEEPRLYHYFRQSGHELGVYRYYRSIKLWVFCDFYIVSTYRLRDWLAVATLHVVASADPIRGTSKKSSFQAKNATRRAAGLWPGCRHQVLEDVAAAGGLAISPWTKWSEGTSKGPLRFPDMVFFENRGTPRMDGFSWKKAIYQNGWFRNLGRTPISRNLHMAIVLFPPPCNPFSAPHARERWLMDSEPVGRRMGLFARVVIMPYFKLGMTNDNDDFSQWI